ncbi:hypothetical protein [Bradyrhizobium sp. SZCCHNR1093]|uniref:hypothetical protein n=1 Tax=Bradyrhizobium sp. SZCCHNR1093 TaxID=3057368 RepID=UPI0028EB1B02|nr:hypothetical protein [Bradyrhizobium sp. SZCCHNR1093]
MRHRSTFRQTFLPYALAKLAPDEFLPLNRYYKPIGIMSDQWVEYESQPSRIRIKGLTNTRAERMGLTVREFEDGSTKLYLYNDGTVPDKSPANWDRYQRILQILAAMEIKAADHVD